MSNVYFKIPRLLRRPTALLVLLFILPISLIMYTMYVAYIELKRAFRDMQFRYLLARELGAWESATKYAIKVLKTGRLQ